jgi:hypothetical protein
MPRHAVPAVVAGSLVLLGLFTVAPAPANDEANRVEEKKVSSRDAAALADEARLQGEREAAKELLGTELPGLDLDKVPLADAVDALRHATGRNIFVNWRALEAAGVKRETRVSILLTQMPLGNALQLLLDMAAGRRDKLGVAVDDGVITISTGDDLAKNTLTRVYDVRDIVSGADLPGGADREARVKALTRLLTGTVAPGTWRESGKDGAVGALRHLQGQLIITQTPENHEAIKRLLAGVGELLRPAKEGEAPKAAGPAEFPLVSTRAQESVAK